MIILHQFPPTWNLPSASPFCIKVETYLRMAKIDYKVHLENNPRRGPKGKMPFIEDEGNIVPDSSFILEYLQKKYDYPLDRGLSETDKATMLAFQRLLEDSLYWVLLYSRWGDPIGWEQIQKEFLPFFPPLVGKPILKLIRSNLLKQGYHQGMLRHSAEEIYHQGEQNLQAICDFLATKPYFMGDEPSTIDTTLYSFLATILWSPISAPTQKTLKEHSSLVAYCENIKNRYWE